MEIRLDADILRFLYDPGQSVQMVRESYPVILIMALLLLLITSYGFIIKLLISKIEKSEKEFQQKKKEIKHTLRCPHCDEKLKKWEVPNSPFIEWDDEYLYICFNDSCPFLVKGWQTMFKQGNLGMSYRLMYNPERDCTITVPVMTLNDLKDGIIE